MTHPMVAIVGEDVGLVALLMALALPEKAIFFIKPRRGNVETKHFRPMSYNLAHFLFLLLLHSFSGCHTNSAVFRMSKVTFVKIFDQKNL